jgi:SHS2 domain-containing protein
MIVSPNAGEKGFDFYTLKDREMAREADYGFMVWDGKSRGTLNNIVNLLSETKSTLLFFSPEESFHTLRNAEDLSALLTKCGKRTLAIFEKKLELSRRLFSFASQRKALLESQTTRSAAVPVHLVR